MATALSSAKSGQCRVQLIQSVVGACNFADVYILPCSIYSEITNMNIISDLLSKTIFLNHNYLDP